MLFSILLFRLVIFYPIHSSLFYDNGLLLGIVTLDFCVDEEKIAIIRLRRLNACYFIISARYILFRQARVGDFIPH